MSSDDQFPIHRWLQENSNNDSVSTPLFSAPATMNDLDFMDVGFNFWEPTFLPNLTSVDISDLLSDDEDAKLPCSNSFTDLVNSVSTEDILNSFTTESESLTSPPAISSVSIDSCIESQDSTENGDENMGIVSYSEEYFTENDSPVEALFANENDNQDIICMSEEYQNYLIFNQQSINETYYLSRSKSYLFSLYYNKSAHINTTWTLHINLEPSAEKNPKKKKPKTLAKCEKPEHNKENWFSCNDVNVRFGDSLQIPLSNNRINRELCIKFFCNSSCSSMYRKSKLHFWIVDSNEVICFEESFNIHVSERPGRDESNVQINQHVNISKWMSLAEYLDLISDPQLINKDVPKLIDYTVQNCKFEVALDNYEYSSGINFSGGIGSPIGFKVTEANVPFSDQSLYLRCFIVDPKSPEKPILCKDPQHIDDFHILRSNSNDCQYMGTKDGIFADERLSILLPLKEKFSLNFKCPNICFVNRNRKYAGLVVILENAAGEMFARRHFKFTIVSRPNRNELNFDYNDDFLDLSSSNPGDMKRKSNKTSESRNKKRKISMKPTLK